MPGLSSIDRRVSSAHDFVWRHRREPYDLTVFQLGNSSHHDYQWPYLFRYPGLVVLHDAHLHHARAAALLRTGRAGDYRSEFAASHPDAPPGAAELAVAGFDSHLYYMWPMTRLVVRASRLAAVHTRRMAEVLGEQVPGAAVETIRLGHGTLVDAGQAAAARARVRAARGLPQDAIVFGVFGGLTPDKRIPQVLDALASVLAYVPSAHLLLAGAPAGHYDVAADVRARGLDAHVTMTGYIETDEALTAHVAACDVSLNLRWPSAREMSGPWLRALAAGCPTVTIDLAHLTDVPSLDPRTWRENYAPASEPRAPSPEPRAPIAERRAPSPERRAPTAERRHRRHRHRGRRSFPAPGDAAAGDGCASCARGSARPASVSGCASTRQRRCWRTTGASWRGRRRLRCLASICRRIFWTMAAGACAS